MSLVQYAGRTTWIWPQMRYIAKSPVTNMPVERDFDFRADKPLSAYLQAAREGKEYA